LRADRSVTIPFGRSVLQRLVDKYFDNATIHAAMRAGEMLEQGQMDGAATWRRALDAGKNCSGRRPGAWCIE
jgi:hypothetical protein